MTVVGRIFGSRKVWIALSAVAGVVVTLVGADPAKWTPLITSIVTLAGVVIASIGYEDGQEKRQGDTGTRGQGDVPPAGVNGYPLPPLKLIAWLALSALALGAAGALCGCSSLTESPADAYVAADHATFDAVAPEYSLYVIGDPTLSTAQKERRLRTTATWRLRVVEAEKDAATTQPALQPVQPLPTGTPPAAAAPADVRLSPVPVPPLPAR